MFRAVVGRFLDEGAFDWRSPSFVGRSIVGALLRSAACLFSPFFSVGVRPCRRETGLERAAKDGQVVTVVFLCLCDASNAFLHVCVHYVVGRFVYDRRVYRFLR